jgi:hypothetical protein
MDITINNPTQNFFRYSTDHSHLPLWILQDNLICLWQGLLFERRLLTNFHHPQKKIPANGRDFNLNLAINYFAASASAWKTVRG